MYVQFPLSLGSVEGLLFERGIDICHETVRMWRNLFGPMFAANIRRQRIQAMRGVQHWHLDEMHVNKVAKWSISGGPSITGVKYSKATSQKLATKRFPSPS